VKARRFPKPLWGVGRRKANAKQERGDGERVLQHGRLYSWDRSIPERRKKEDWASMKAAAKTVRGRGVEKGKIN